MIAGLHLHIRALNAILPRSFIFLLDSTDRSFVYNSIECNRSKTEILNLDKAKGLDLLLLDRSFYSEENDNYSVIIRKFGSHEYLGLFAFKEKFSSNQIQAAKDIFLGI